MEQDFWQDVVISSKSRHSLYDICFLENINSKKESNENFVENISYEIFEEIPNDLPSEAVSNKILADNEQINNYNSVEFSGNDVSSMLQEPTQVVSESCMREQISDITDKNKILKEYLQMPCIFIPGTKLIFSGLNQSNESPKFYSQIMKWFSNILN
ncbi:hypothetical protein HHI36_010311 [Cryptolaemus montrouzieri]|uniref:Uncharacterized protein n=1 Tax=Cryptolaemus montrouzieri TaxID=559131 RepID=A0ABD2MIK6_9CUCU